ncbi:MAG: ABC transporter substrate-binding protein [Armatimonadetes bacterium]|nr:ABC transporter substrate-binding protein [Armatimonadota bacterium]
MRPGDILQDRYRVVEFLGQGGAGAVFLCQDLRLDGKKWAVKEYLCHDREAAADSFAREAKMLSRLRHPNLPVLVDFFSLPDRHYLVMEYVEGATLARTIEAQGPPDQAEVIQWATELAEVLRYLHHQERPVIYRDLKPENIIVTEDRQLKLVDFGLARHFDPRKSSDTRSSGSVGYAPPEQWDDAMQTDERSDIYSLGATLYFVLTGKPPSPIYGSHRIRPYRPDVGPGVEALILRCLQPERSQRYGCMEEVLADLRTLSGRLPPVSYRPPAPGQPVPVLVSGAPSGRSSPRWLLLLLCLATFSFLTGAAVGWRGTAAPPGREENTELQSARRLIQEQRYVQAVEILDRLVTRHPRNAEAHILLQNAYVLLQGRKAYRIPVVTSLTGIEQDGYQLLYGLAMAQKEHNLEPSSSEEAAGGDAMLLDIYDDRSSVERLLEIIRDIAENPEYAVMIGPFNSQQTLAAAPLLNSAAFPAVTPTASDPRVWSAGDYVFTVSDQDRSKSRLMARRFISIGLRRAAVLYDHERIVARTGVEEFIRLFKELGGEVVLEEPYSEATADVPRLIQNVAASGADCIFLGDYRAAVVSRFAEELRTQDITMPVGAMTQAYSQSLLEMGGRNVEGLMMGSHFSPDFDTPRVKLFSQDFSQSFDGLRPSQREVYAYDALRVVADAIREVGFDREALRAYFKSLGDTRPAYTGVSGEFALSFPLERRQPCLVEIRNGQYHLNEYFDAP